MPNSFIKIFKRCGGALAVLAALAVAPRASAFTVYGPLEGWQTITLDYGTRYYYGNDIEPGGPKNFGQGSRLNVPVVTYAFDYTFLNYFGAQGVAAVDAAMNEMNRLPSASSANLAKFLTQDNQQINYTAQALALTDLKSTVMSLMLEHMGLEGETHVWDIHIRAPVAGTTCEWEYDVINRNFDAVSWNPSAYVNGVQYGYFIWDGCVAGVQVADAVEQAVNSSSTAQFNYTAVATRYGQVPGGYYLGITRDDMGGLSYLYRANNYQFETLDTNSVATALGSSPYSPISNTNSSGTGAGGATAATNFSGLMGGVEKITFVKVAYDSLLGGTFAPKSYNFSIPVVTNNTLRPLRITRTVTAPDIIFAAGDLTVVPDQIMPDNYPNPYVRTNTFILSTLLTQGAAPVLNAVISPQEVITFNDVTGVYVNINPAFLDSVQFVLYPTLLWGSFDGSTNAPTVYPNQSSINGLQSQILSGSSALSLGIYSPISITNSTNATTTTTGGTSGP